MHKNALIQALKELGVKPRDTLFVHSDLRPFGIPEQAQTKEEILRFYYDIFLEVLGPQGTLVVPAYFYEYARNGELFDVETSPVSKTLGVFSSFINALPGRVRSCNPLQSLAAIGSHAEEICGGDSLMGYGLTSPWHKLRTLGAKMLFLGVTLQPMTFVHHIEQQFGVPHLYQKLYHSPILRNGIPVPGIAISSVRYLEYKIHYELSFFQGELERRGLLKKSSIGYLVSFEEAFQTGLTLLSQNPYCFLENPPAFIPGKIPTDGVTHGK